MFALGKRGFQPAPTNLKLLRGERNKSRINLDEPVPAPAPLVVPDYLSEEARAVWSRLEPDLVDKGLLTAWDVNQFAVYCDAVARYEKASVMVNKTGLLIAGQKSAAVRNPAMQLVRDLATLIRGYAQEFGLTPSARGQIAVERGERGGRAERLLS